MYHDVCMNIYIYMYFTYLYMYIYDVSDLSDASDASDVSQCVCGGEVLMFHNVCVYNTYIHTYIYI